MDRSQTDVWVGLFVAVGILSLLFLALRVGNYGSSEFVQPYQLTARFENVGQLKTRAPVKAAGVTVGRVLGIRLNPKTYDAVVTLEIDRRYVFPQDTSASVLTSGLLGEQYIGLDPGPDEHMLKEGASITSTQSAVVLEKLISQFLFSKAQQ